MTRAELLDQITAFHDHLWALYSTALATCETGEMEAVMAEHHTCYFGTGAADQFAVCDKAACIEGLRSSFAKPSTAKFRMEGRQIRLRGLDQAVIAFEKVMEKDGQVLTRFFCIECYRLVDGQWRLFRETVEHAGA
ncbi:MAG TPA: hypothetical protein VNT01_13630 [Symbiobacteriaceae bacterium]|nr:hypothetical protein [Symbiobacteriaceae bacterium]